MRSIATFALSALVALTSAVDLRVGNSGGQAVSPLQYGIFFEDINHSGDGGIYAELIQNRAFQANSTQFVAMAPWTPASNANLSIDESSPLSGALPYSVSVAAAQGASTAGLTNPGWWGIDVKPQVYVGSFWVRGAYYGNFTVSLHSNLTDQVFASKQVVSEAQPNSWTQHNFTLNPTVAAPNSNNSFTLSYESAGASAPLSFNLISLFPPTFKDRANGMRIDLMEALQGLSPSFLRFPGGNNLEGNDPPNHWKWNQTIGPLTQRPGRTGVWGYDNTDGIGLDEYFHWCTDLVVEPILAIWDGFYLNGPALSEADLNFYVQDALAELEYVLGNASTHWGAIRAQNGHPDPYQLNYVEIGNEDNLGGGLDTYAAYRFNAFNSAIKGAYPNLNVVSSTISLALPNNTAGDYHQYTRPDMYPEQFTMFNANTSSNRVFIGEYAVVQPNNGSVPEVMDPTVPQVEWPFWLGTVAEAIFLLGAENNAASIIGASYAPTFQNLNSYTWAPDLISFTADPAQDVLSTSYQGLKLLSSTRMTTTRPIITTDQPGPAYWVAGQNVNTGSDIFKAAVYNATQDVEFTVEFAGLAASTLAQLTVLTAPDALSVATIGQNPVNTTVRHLTSMDDRYTFCLPPLSIAVLETQTGGYGKKKAFHG